MAQKPAQPAMRWTDAEIAVVREHWETNRDFVYATLPRRTRMAIDAYAHAKLGLSLKAAWRRRSRGHRQKGDPWSKKELRLLKDLYRTDRKTLYQLLPHRTPQAIAYQAKVHDARIRSIAPWTTSDIRALRELYPDAPQDKIIAAFPGRSWKTIQMQAMAHGIKRNRLYVSPRAHLDKLIIERAREIGLPLSVLDKLTGCARGYWYQRNRRPAPIEKVAAAIEELGGRLTIVWCEDDEQEGPTAAEVQPPLPGSRFYRPSWDRVEVHHG